MKKRYLVLAVSAIMTLAGAATAFAGNWETADNITWKYMNDNGQYTVSAWQWIDSNADGIAECYYFDENGVMQKSTSVDTYTLSPEGQWYVDGAVQTKPTAELNSGWYMNCGFWRYSYKNEDVKGTLKKVGSNIYYFDENGNMVTGFEVVDGERYYFDNSGAMVKKTFKLDGVYYVVERDGTITDEVDSDDWGKYKKENDYKPKGITNFDVKTENSASGNGTGNDNSGAGNNSGNGNGGAGDEHANENGLSSDNNSGNAGNSDDASDGEKKKGNSGPAGDSSLKSESSTMKKPEASEKEEKQEPPSGYGADKIPDELKKAYEEALRVEEEKEAKKQSQD